MSRRNSPALLPLLALVLVLVPAVVLAQTGVIAGVVRDSQGGVLPGVTVEVSSPQLIEKVRVTATDGNGRYQIAGLPVGTYKVSFKLEKFSTVERSNVELTSDFTAPINADLKIGAATEIVTVQGSAVQTVDVQNARQRQVFSRDELVDLPLTRNVNSLINLVPGIAMGAANAGNSVPVICSGGQADAGGGPVGIGGNASGAFSGCGPITYGFNAHSSTNDPAAINQGRMQVDGLGIQSFGGGGRSSYIADIGNAQEVTFTLSGSLGESETGGTTINLIPRTGGNRYAGNFFTGYSSGGFYGKNNESRPSGFQNRLDYEYDVNGSYGGPIVRDRLWFYGSMRRQERSSLLYSNFRNINEGIFGANYRVNIDEQVIQDDLYQNASMRLTVQATQRDKFNLFWDEQYTCETPCHGTAGGVSMEAQGSVLTYPLHLGQVSWTNPLTNKILLEAAFSHYGSHRDETENQGVQRYPSIPRIAESGQTNDYVNAPNANGNAITSGSINNAINWNNDNIQSRASASYVTGSHNVKLGYQGAYLSRISRPYFNDLRLQYTYTTPTIPTACTTAACVSAANAVNGGGGNQRLVTTTTPTGQTAIQNGCYFNTTPLVGTAIPQQISTTTGATSDRPWCGAINMPGNPTGWNDPLNSGLRPIPTSVTQYIENSSDEKAWFAGLYLQDQWTLNRFTFNGALRYDNAQSNFGKTCVGPDLYKPDQQYCLNDPALGDGKGVRFQDITPRWGVAWDVFGNGKTSIKYSQGKYLDGVQAGGIYTAMNPAAAGRTVNSYQRNWSDANGDRVVDCDLTIPATAPNVGLPASGECTGPTDGNNLNGRRFGRSPDDLDDAGIPIALGTVNCGQYENSMSVYARTYCDNYLLGGGKNLTKGWGVRRYEWQWSLGIQHEVLPRMSAEVTYNRRQYGNVTVTDALGTGCDLYQIDEKPVNPKQCMEDLLNFKSPYYDFYSVQAPVDQRLPGGGGYQVSGIATAKQRSVAVAANGTQTVTYLTAPASVGVSAVTIAPDGGNVDYWSGVDTNIVIRARGGLRISGGTSTGRRNVDTCGVLVDDPPTGVALMEGRERDCNRERIFQTNVRGTASYTIPWIDVLASTTFSYRPGVQINANYQVGLGDLVWTSDAVILESSNPCATPTSVSCTLPAGQQRTTALTGNTTGFTTRNLLSNDTYGEGIRLVDLRFAKNIRFGGKRLNLGMDVFNLFNSDAALAYCANFPNPSQNVLGCAQNTQPWASVTNITTPRYARFQLTFDF